jgi:hypothetical protein
VARLKGAVMAEMRATCPQCGAELSLERPETWPQERREMLAILRQAVFWDDRWSDDVYLPDLLDAYLWRFVDRKDAHP